MYSLLEIGDSVMVMDGAGILRINLGPALKSIYFGLIACLLAGLIMAGPAKADEVPPCQLPSGAASVSLLSKAPSAIKHALQQNVGEVVEPGEKFDATDVMVTGHSRRLIFIWNTGSRWIVAIERGGIAYSDPIFVYNLSADNQKAELLETRTAIPRTVCSTALSIVKE